MDIEEAIFFDNDEVRLNEVGSFCRNISLVKVPETRSDIMETPFVDVSIRDFIDSEKEKGNIYLNRIIELGIKGDRYDAVSGINDTHNSIINEWLKNTEDSRNRAVLFDWDRTITKVEGFYNLSAVAPLEYREAHNLDYKKLLEDTLIYLCWGNERLEMVRNLMRTLHHNNIHIFILTNNSGCGSPEYLHLLKQLFQEIPFLTICGKFYGFNKGEALRSHRKFTNICKHIESVRDSRKRKSRRRTKRRSKNNKT